MIQPWANTTEVSPLLSSAAEVLGAEGFDLKSLTTDNLASPMLLAENEYFILGLSAFGDAQELAAVEGAAAVGLAEAVIESGSKRWDLYLVLLTESESQDDAMSEVVTEILYNTRYLRRVVRWDVSAVGEFMRFALRPFLPLPPHRAAGDMVEDPLRELWERLPLHGVAHDQVRKAIAQWESAEGRQTGYRP